MPLCCAGLLCAVALRARGCMDRYLGASLSTALGSPRLVGLVSKLMTGRFVHLSRAGARRTGTWPWLPHHPRDHPAQCGWALSSWLPMPNWKETRSVSSQPVRDLTSARDALALSPHPPYKY
ncbi:hypothetical protein BGZ61DRAFT_8829 [Ilyonectria robusta]|uniref:uncharacterized protein n=1 Tax=Ilyonectria robusta TaxID=1079257 RepID=UPI001E8D7506|nr:uncharacterized protein BGZ61DRAFT_8829 [Ilyonectria robusta]KAH8737071.1 hypothetical protein BGZ61DRAFT_8829 [Ilyonectria robusta]